MHDKVRRNHEWRCDWCEKRIFTKRKDENRVPHISAIGTTLCTGNLVYVKNWKGDAQVRRNRRNKATYILGIDGEGIGRKPHRYVFLAASDESGKEQYRVENLKGLSTVECLDFILSLPNKGRIFAYSFGYDITKILEDLPNKHLYYFIRPGRRKCPPPKYGYVAVRWKGYKLNLSGSKFCVTRKGKTVTIWDIFKFYQGKFVDALTEWKVGTPEMLERMSDMKNQRADLDRIYKSNPERVHQYCLEECACMAALARKLIKAHDDAGLELNQFNGAGSSASAMLKKHGVKELIVAPPEHLKEIIAMAFFGGRFENSVAGVIKETVHNYDIASAYPYQCCRLPCLIHGRWRHTTNRDELVLRTNPHLKTALVRYTLRNGGDIRTWGPFPYRSPNGTICYPVASGGGWIYLEEYLAGEKLFPKSVVFHEAWLYETECDCKPFAFVPKYYIERLAIGKDGPGIVYKLALNSIYGKLAQSLGTAPFNCWFWAGLVTSGCRAQALQMLALHKNRDNLLMIATDGIFTLEELTPPPPEDTGTWNAIDVRDGKAKPLGSWEHKAIEGGIFVAKPGIYFRLNPQPKEIKTIRGRGVGRYTIYKNWQLIVDTYEMGRGELSVFFENIPRFCGIKSSIHERASLLREKATGKPMSYHYLRADGAGSDWEYNKHTKKWFYHQYPAYGQWTERPSILDFSPLPKRSAIAPNLRDLLLRSDIPLDRMSMPYNKATRGKVQDDLEQLKEWELEQPDIDCEYDYDDDGGPPG